ncbi:MAG: hypothetical protein HGB14_07445, partial [Anaerolineaceae bacterium]|nr:hypothetical protein [Anaerolineaceae bacterium]
MRFLKLNLPYQPYLNKTTPDDDILYREYSCFSYAVFHWYLLSLPVVIFGAIKMNRMIRENRDLLPLLAVSGAFIFVLSSLKLPS